MCLTTSNKKTLKKCSVSNVSVQTPDSQASNLEPKLG